MRMLLFLSALTLSASAFGQDVGNYRESEALSIEALSRLRLSVPGDANQLFLDHCRRGMRLNVTQTVAASGYNLPIPFGVIDESQLFCRCAIELAVTANRIVTEIFEIPDPVSGGFDPAELASATLLPKSAVDENAFAICKAGRWALGFTASGLELHVNGIGYFGGLKQLVSGHVVNRSEAADRAWQGYLRDDFGGVR